MASSVSVSVPIWLTLMRIELPTPVSMPRLRRSVFVTNRSSPTSWMRSPIWSVSAERHWPEGSQDEVLVHERPEGRFVRQVMLGEQLDTEQLKAGYQGGVLTLTIPIAERAKPRKIAITAEEQSPEAVDTTATPAAEQGS